MVETTPSRRRLLQVSCAAFTVGVAGCTGLLSDGEERESSESESERGNENDSENESDAETGAENEAGTESETETDESNDSDTASDDSDDDSTPPFDIEEPPGTYADVPIPDDPRSAEYPIAGTGDAPVRVRLFGGWKCRHTRRFVLGSFEGIVDEYVRTGSIDIEFHGVAYRDGDTLHGDDGPRTARTGLVVWHNQPEVFWSYLEYMYTNMERRDGWATPERLGAIAAEVGFESPDALADVADSDVFEPQLEGTMDRVEDLSVTDVPRLEIEGEVYAPNLEPEETRAALEAAVDGARDGGDETNDEAEEEGEEAETGTEDRDGDDSAGETDTESAEEGDGEETASDDAGTDADGGGEETSDTDGGGETESDTDGGSEETSATDESSIEEETPDDRDETDDGDEGDRADTGSDE